MSVFKDSIDTFLTPVKGYLEGDSVSEVLCNGPFEVFIERKGVLQRTDARFKDEQALQAAVRNIAQFVGRTIDEDNPTLDARLPDGSRIHAVFPPCSRKGTSLSIRKFSKEIPKFVDLIKWKSLTKPAARFIDICVYLAKNVIVSGGTGSGKTTLLNIIGTRIPKAERVLIIEDSSELKINSDHVVFFETKMADEQGLGGVSMRDLMRSALRLRPDRIVIGEVRGPEALDLITAMNTGHGGSMGTVHANTPYDALIRLETLSMMGDTQIPTAALRRQISSAIHIIVQTKRLSDGRRVISHISEVLPDVDPHTERYQIQDIFIYVQRGKKKDGAVVGELAPTGTLPSFMDEIQINGIPFGTENFKKPDWAIQMTNKKATSKKVA